MGNPVVHELDIQPVELFQIREVLRCILHTIMFNRALGLVRPVSVESQLFDSISYVQCGDPNVGKRIDEKIEQLCALVEKSPSFTSSASAAASQSSLSASSSDSSVTKAQLCLSFFERRHAKKLTPSTSLGGVSSWFGVATSLSGISNATGVGSGSGSAKGAANQSSSSSSSASDSPATRGACWEQWVLNLSVLPQQKGSQSQAHTPPGSGSGQAHTQQGPGLSPFKALGMSGGSACSSSASSSTTAVESSHESAERSKRSARLEAELRELLLTVLVLANQNRECIPPVLTADIVPFPYEITVPSLFESAFGMDLLKRVLQATPPPLLT